MNNLPFNWFDIAVLMILAVGIQRGRKRGMSQELLPVLQWLVIVVGCGAIYEFVGKILYQKLALFSQLTCYLVAYSSLAILVALVFATARRQLGGKLIGSDIFGRSEYYLGMAAGGVRFLCMLLVALALLNARLYTNAEIQAEAKYQADVYGSSFFPTLYSIQSQVFEQSFLGPLIKTNLPSVLITPTAPEERKFKQKQWNMP